MDTEKTDKLGFITRLRSILGTSNTAEVARKIGVPYNTFKNYVDGRLPNAEVLTTIAENTNINLNWLLTGTGSRFTYNAKPENIPDLEINDMDDVQHTKSLVIEIPATKFRIKLVSNNDILDESTNYVLEEIPLYLSDSNATDYGKSSKKQLSYKADISNPEEERRKD